MASSHQPQPSLSREMGLLTLAATGICSMLGAAINIIPFTIQRSVPGIGPYVLLAFLLGAVPAVFAALAYAHLASAMPRAGGSYVYASRALHPFLGFVASFSQWFGICVAIGVVSYVLPNPFLRDIAVTLDLAGLADALQNRGVRLAVSLVFVWVFVGINVRGLKVYAKTLIPLMILMFVLGAVVIASGLVFDQSDFAAALAVRGETIPAPQPVSLSFGSLLAAAAILFSSFIGFDSIAQAGGEAKNPNRSMPLAIGIAVLSVGTFYMLFTAAVYHVVPWRFVAERALVEDVAAPGLLGYVLSPGWTVLIVAGATVALINDLPAMLLATSRLMFAWAEDEVFPAAVAAVNRRFHTPHVALVCSGLMATGTIVGSHLAGDFFLGVDILATALLVNFLLMCLCVIILPLKNPRIAAQAGFLTKRRNQVVVGGVGSVVLTIFLVSHIGKDLKSTMPAWYFHSTALWIAVMATASAIFGYHWRKLRRRGVDLEARFAELPPD